MSEVYADSIQAKVNGTSQSVPIRDITKAPAITESTSGESIQLSDSGDAPLTDIKLYGKSKQDGEPSPDNPVEIEIPGSDGNVEIDAACEQLLPPFLSDGSSDGVNFAMSKDGGYHISGTASVITDMYMIGKPASSDNAWEEFYYPEGIYKISCENIPNNLSLVFVIKDRLGGSSNIVISITSISTNQTINILDGDMVRVFFRANNGYNADVTLYPMLNAGSSVIPWEPYKHTSATLPTPNGLPGIPVASGGNYTDADGQQWICDEIDYARGKYVQRIMIDNLRNCVWIDSWNSAYNIDGTFLVYTEKYNNIVSSDRWHNVKCSHFKNFSASILSDPNARMGFGEGGAFNAAFRVPTTLASNIDEWEEWIQQNDITFMLILAASVETDITTEQLTALKQLRTYQTVTNITTDSEPQVGMEIEYTADTKTYIDNKFAEIAQSLAATQNTLLQEV